MGLQLRQWREGMALGWLPACALGLLAAEPPLDAWPLGWLALIPLAAALGAPRGSVAGWVTWGWLLGGVYWAGQFAWLHETLVVHGGMGLLHFVNFYALGAALLGLGFAAALGLARAAWRRWGIAPGLVLAGALAVQDVLLGAAPFGGIAWGSLAGPQAHTWAARLVAPLLGGAGVVLLLGLLAAGWAAWLGGLHGASPRAPRRVAALAALALVSAACTLPAPSPVEKPGARRLLALLVPGDLSIGTLAAQRGTLAPLRYYLARTLDGLPQLPRDGPPTLVIWPESAVPGSVEHGKALVELSELGGLLHADLLLGSNAVVRGREVNSLFLVNGGRFDFWRYDKRQLVPFGEYVPAGWRWLFPRKVAAGEADYAPGDGPPLLVRRGERLGVAICFESILPGHARLAVAGGATLLVAVANDAWLTPTARRQHVQLTALRGLEVGRAVLMVANRGWSGLLDGGRALQLADWQGPPLPVSAPLREGRTPYARWGHGPLALLLIGGAGLLLAPRLRRGRGGSAPR